MSDTLTAPTLEDAMARAAQGDLAGADAIFQRLHKPAAPDAGLLFAWARVRRQAGDADGAFNILQAAGRAGAGGRAALELASLLLDLGRAEQATPYLREASSHGRGTGLDFEAARWEVANGRFDRAAAMFRALFRAEPRHLPARLGYAQAMLRSGNLQEAEAAYIALLNRAPDHAVAISELAYVYGMQRKFAAALPLYDRLARLGADVTREISQVALGMMHMCDWSQRAELTARLVARMDQPAPCNLETYTLLGAVDDPALHRRMGEHFAAVINGLGEKRIHPAPRSVGPATQRLRIGYLSGDFNQHATSLLLAGIIEAHDRENFEVFAYDHSSDDRSSMRQRMRAAFEHFRIIETDGPEAAAARIAADGIDILVDLKGYTERTRTEIAALRPAPVQVSFLGYAATQAAPWIDYVIADETVLPESEYGNWTETPVLMPASYYPNDRSRPAVNGSVPPPEAGRAAQGLPEDAVVFCCFNNTFKISPEIFAVWMSLLRDVPGSVLWLFEGNEFVTANLRKEAGDLAARLVWAKPATLEDHLARHACADVFLDTMPYGAHTTGADALWCGVPMVTCMGHSFASRVGASLLRAVGMNELVCGSLDEYAELARTLAADPVRRASLRDRLIAARDTALLFDATQFARALERAYTQMADRARAGDAPALIRA